MVRLSIIIINYKYFYFAIVSYYLDNYICYILINTKIMKTINTTVKTGDQFIYNNQIHRVGIIKKINNKMLIHLHIKLDATSGVTRFVSTRELNKMLKEATILN